MKMFLHTTINLYISGTWNDGEKKGFDDYQIITFDLLTYFFQTILLYVK